MNKKRLWLYMGILTFCLMALGCAVWGGAGYAPGHWHCYQWRDTHGDQYRNCEIERQRSTPNSLYYAGEGRSKT